MTEELKPCPFCGGQAEHGFSDEFYSCANAGMCREATIKCTGCVAEMTGSISFEMGDEAHQILATRWNKRVEQ